MVTEKQIAANRENAKKSTGPRTPEGKAISSGNAIKHGLTATKRVVLADEKQEQFEAMREHLIDEMQTGTALEKILVEEIAAIAWRLRRAARIERDMMSEDLRQAAADRRDEQGDDADGRGECGLFGEQIGKRFIEDESYANLGRYEMRLRRGLFRTVRELRLVRGQYFKTVKMFRCRDMSGGFSYDVPYQFNPYLSDEGVAFLAEHEDMRATGPPGPGADRQTAGDTSGREWPADAAPASRDGIADRAAEQHAASPDEPRVAAPDGQRIGAPDGGRVGASRPDASPTANPRPSAER